MPQAIQTLTLFWWDEFQKKKEAKKKNHSGGERLRTGSRKGYFKRGLSPSCEKNPRFFPAIHLRTHGGIVCIYTWNFYFFLSFPHSTFCGMWKGHPRGFGRAPLLKWPFGRGARSFPIGEYSCFKRSDRFRRSSPLQQEEL